MKNTRKIWKKKKSRLDKVNYRPVSNLKAASKVLEIIVNQQVLRFFEINNLLPSSQHGFRASRSTFSAVASMHETWLKNYEEGKSSLAALFDLSAAFDTMSKDIFCQKLTPYGFSENARSAFQLEVMALDFGLEVAGQIPKELRFK